MSKVAFITGIAGQDGSYLCEYLLSLGYKVYGIIRRNSTPEHQITRIEHIHNVHTFYGDLLDVSSLTKIISDLKPDEIYNTAAQSHVRISFDIPQFTLQANALGVLNLLEVCKTVSPTSRIYQCSSSEMFGNSVDEDGFQRETTPMQPVSPYGCSKLCAYMLMRTYRQSYNMFCSNGILFNHESPRRGSNFVTSKVVKGAIEILIGKQRKLELGNLDSYRDWGHSKDYVRAIHLINNHHTPDDFVVATGQTHSIRELCEYVFNSLGMDYKDYVVQNPKYLRPNELKYLKGDRSKFSSVFPQWQPQYSFNTLLDDMINHWKEIYNI